MDLSNLRPPKGSKHSRRRIGRGRGSGYGKTSTRGHNGAKSRSGSRRMPHFEGGQMPLQKRVPKYGFKNINNVEYKVLNLDDVQRIADKHQLNEVDVDTLRAKNLLTKKARLKVLGDGALSKKLSIRVHSVSKSAREAIEKAGGTVNLIQ